MKCLDITEEKLKELVEMNFSIKKIAKEFSVSAATIRLYLKKYDLKTNFTIQHSNGNNCKYCSKELKGLQRFFCSGACKANYYYHNNNKKQKSLYQMARSLAAKKELLEIKLGKCEICGYNKNIAALCFHHINESEKSFQLSGRTLGTMPKEKLLKELDKCMLLCHNCHMEIHHPHLNN